ncbi:site-specific integrase [Flammeovirga pectinis]|uniref:Site-specific integrase n=1 Tax=Flammeovirga pectinis TaxID=2494373 RepID=A0A3S9P426_9BACT|nr:site-specific integrase [Flammeovirga pectinis]AZQ62832.1 site-specific integrase [Flammeovirga pectinis]
MNKQIIRVGKHKYPVTQSGRQTLAIYLDDEDNKREYIKTKLFIYKSPIDSNQKDHNKLALLEIEKKVIEAKNQYIGNSDYFQIKTIFELFSEIKKVKRTSSSYLSRYNTLEGKIIKTDFNLNKLNLEMASSILSKIDNYPKSDSTKSNLGVAFIDAIKIAVNHFKLPLPLDINSPIVSKQITPVRVQRVASMNMDSKSADFLLSKHDSLLWKVALLFGLRAEEIMELREEQFTVNRGYVILDYIPLKNKTRTIKRVFCNINLWLHYTNISKHFDVYNTKKNTLLIDVYDNLANKSYINREVKRVRTILGNNVNLHSCRKFMVTVMFEKGVDAITLNDWNHVTSQDVTQHNYVMTNTKKMQASDVYASYYIEGFNSMNDSISIQGLADESDVMHQKKLIVKKFLEVCQDEQHIDLLIMIINGFDKTIYNMK